MTRQKNPRTDRIGLLTLPLHTNYGGILQIAALYNLLVGQGRKVTLIRAAPARPAIAQLISAVLKIIPFQNVAGVRGRALAAAKHRAFIDTYLPNRTPILRTKAALNAEARKRGFDAVIVGSDQVWRPDFSQGVDFRHYLLDFVDEGVRRVSYAASFGRSEWQDAAMTQEVRALLARLNTITVREDSGLDICARTFGRDDAELVLDPTLLMPTAFYEAMLPSNLLSQSSVPTLMKYVLDASDDLLRLENSAMRILGPSARSGGIYLDRQSRQASVPEWLAAFRNADLVVTDSFHGMAFSIIFRKQFVALVNEERGSDRFTSLARQLGVEDRLAFVGTDPVWPTTEIDYSRVEARLEARREESLFVLQKALD